ncbi:MAG TPA: Lpg1974 family pore-forming outer membrane protein, partial [Caulobacteraceae bacterium]|nr:Lpg1974 family pore-forming outer membrane protein [Caulobacteraceae bacterium]
GNEDWTLMRPHPTQSSNCIVPTYLLTYSGTSIDIPGGVGAGGLSGCEQLWLLRETATPAPGVSFDPDTAPPEVNNGQGFYKELGGNELPNAPNFTATITADYTIPMANDWLATLHTDLYYQSEAWTRIFNTEGYDKLKAYTNVNLAAIFTNEELGWKIMAYIKNVFDRDSITGAFINSDDTGLTTNVFLTEPRLYGLRVTKEWTGGPWWTGANLGHKGPYPLTVELGGQVQRHDAPYATVAPSFAGEFYDEVNTFDESQHQDLDWGDGRSLELTYRPGGGDIKLVAGMRYGRTNGTGPKVRAEEETPLTCAFAGYYATFCAKYPGVRIEDNGFYSSGTNWSSSQSRSREEHMMADFSVGRDVALGSLDSSVSVGLRYARLESLTAMAMQGVPNWVLPDGFAGKYESTRTDYRAELTAQREFSGTGPVVTWDGSIPLLGDDTTGRLELEWSASGGLLYGKQETTIQGSEVASYYAGVGLLAATGRIEPFDVVATEANIRRPRSVNAPVLDLSMGLSYDVGRLKLSTGYRWERYFDVLDVGNDERQDADRTIDGPYFKLAIGFGG